MGRFRVRLQWRLPMQGPTRDVLIQHRAAGIESGPQRRLVWPMLPQQRLQRHGLMGAFNLGVVGGLALRGKAHVDPQGQEPQMQAGRKG
jgi:hypothetical protein